MMSPLAAWFDLNLVEMAVRIAMAMVGLALLLALARLIRGPTLPDRVVALDLVATLAMGMIVAYEIHTEQPVFLDVATVGVLIAFLGTVAFAHYLERRHRDE
jgi:multicomponent Na+:H+ antiporter subunit F